MIILKRHGLMVAALAFLATGSVMPPPTAVAAGPAYSPDAAASQQQVNPMKPPRCAVDVINDGTASAGENIGGKPARYQYGDSPYLGLRYDSCADVVKIYFGGYTGITHYNLRDQSGFQSELGPRERGVTSVRASAYPSNWSWTVQACKKGGALQKSSCTRWSPPVTVRITPRNP